MQGPQENQEASQESLSALRDELQRKQVEAQAKGLPFNQNAYLRRMVQGKGQYYDSAEYVLRNGWGETKQQAYFNEKIQHPQVKQTVSRFHAQPQTADDDDKDDE